MQKQDTGKFRQKLLREISRKNIFLLLVSALIFTLGQLAIVINNNENEARAHMRQLQASYEQLDRVSTAFLMDENVKSYAVSILDGEENTDALDRELRKTNSKSPVEVNYLISDTSGNAAASSMESGRLNSYFVNYNAAICYRARELSGDEIYRSVFFDYGTYSDRMLVRPLYDGETLKGYISLFISGSLWNYYLSEENFDGVITDLRGNILYSSKRAFTSIDNKFSPGAGKLIVMVNGLRYWMRSEMTADGNAIVYSLVYYPVNAAYTSGLLALLLFSAAWYIISSRIFKAVADRTAAGIEHIVQELRYIRKVDASHRMTAESDDEFSEVAYQTNYMLDALQTLNDRNTELLKLNSSIEIEQLNAQINPHFLYNTLEIIRNLALFDGEKAEKAITHLTNVLRYSIDFSRSEVTVQEDMDYLENYLEIQRIRFGSRFSCTIDMEPSCLECVVPKLLLQPLLENSIKYGFRNSMELHITVKGSFDGRCLVLQVTDDGGGMDEEKAQELQSQLEAHDTGAPAIGLRNLSRRLYLKYGEGSGLTVANRQGEGFQVMVHIIYGGAENV